MLYKSNQILFVTYTCLADVFAGIAYMHFYSCKYTCLADVFAGIAYMHFYSCKYTCETTYISIKLFWNVDPNVTHCPIERPKSIPEYLLGWRNIFKNIWTANNRWNSVVLILLWCVKIDIAIYLSRWIVIYCNDHLGPDGISHSRPERRLSRRMRCSLLWPGTGGAQGATTNFYKVNSWGNN
jgi:hypothetical protein